MVSFPLPSSELSPKIVENENHHNECNAKVIFGLKKRNCTDSRTMTLSFFQVEMLSSLQISGFGNLF